MSGEEQKQFKRTYFAAGAICLCFLTCSLLFVFHMMQQNEQENIQYLYNTASQNCTTVKKQVVGDFQTLEGVAICIGEAQLEEQEQLSAILKKINDNNAFTRMGIADLNGSVDLLDVNGHTYFGLDVSDWEFFKSALQGQDTISDTLLDPLDNEDGSRYINYYGVPVERQGQVIGVLCAVNSAELLLDIVDAPVLNGKGFSGIFASDGTAVIRSAKAEETFGRDHLNQVEGMAEADLLEIYENMEAGKSGQFTYSSRGETQIGVYVPTGIRDWYMFSMVSASMLRQRYSQTAMGTFSIIAAACLIFCYLLYRQNWLMNNSRQALVRLAYEDQLTGCRNLPKFLIDAQQVISSGKGETYALWYGDLARFKYFNDIFGYDAGDQVLKYMANMFSEHMRGEELFCRVSADNFAGLRAYRNREELQQWFDSLQSCLNNAEPTATNRLHVELCMGFYCVGENNETLSVTEMVNRATMAQKIAKNMNGRKCTLFSSEIRGQILRDAEMEATGRQALEKGEFVFYFQPKVSIVNGDRLAGAEALVRWHNKEKGLISPAAFIPLFERNGFIVPLDRYIFEQVCRWYSGYLAAGRRRINVAVNVSRLGMLQEDFVEYYSRIKEKYEIPDGCIELEFTEGMIVDNEMFKETVYRIKGKGFVCSMDDFGSSYSSLNLLKNLPIDVLKLDILFFQEGTDLYREQVVISNVIAMAKQLQIKTIAEGVEVESQVEFLKEAGCDVVQGYVFAKPMPLAEFEELLDRIEKDDMHMHTAASGQN